MRRHRTLLVTGIVLSTGIASPAAPVRFREVVIDPAAANKTCYAVELADVDGDADHDIVAVTENRVQWYANPGWEKHVILENQTEPDNVCLAAHDIDRDGKIDFALGAGWTKTGTIQWITRTGDPHARWTVYAIGVEPSTHRMRWANVLGRDRPQLVVSPLNASTGGGVRLTAFEVPPNPHTDRWPAVVLDDGLNRMHNHWHIDFNDDQVDATLTASQEGLHLIRRAADGEFRRRKIGSGQPGSTPETSGAGEIKTGRMAGGRPFMATIEPMHGTTVAVYTAPPELPEGELATRHVLDESLQQGHAVWCADLDGDGADEVIAGHREPGTGPVRGPGIYVYRQTSGDGSQWEKHVIDDGGMACEDLVCADLTGDGRIDIVAVGRKTRNVKLYVNAGPQPP
jgi:hypothetical protein